MPLRFGEWLSKFTDIVNVGKIIVDGGPGAILAIALVIILSHLAKVPVLPLGSLFDSNHAKLLAEITEKRTEVVKKEKERQSLIMGQADKATLLGTRRAEVEAVRNERSSLELRGVERGTVRYARLLGRENALEIEIVELGNNISEAEGEKGRLTEELAAERAELDRLLERQQGFRALHVESGTDVLNLVLDHLIGLILVGYLLGTLLNPVYRAVFTNWADLLVLRYPRSVSMLGGSPKPPNAEQLSQLRREVTRLRSRVVTSGQRLGGL